ncbi:MAG TPA: hypothetical protein VF832_07420 [Longimicrobiales bacterium]
MLRQALLLLIAVAPVRAQTLIAYGTVLDRFGTPVPGATVVVTSVDVSPGVPARERLPVGPGQCVGARPVSARTAAGADGRFRLSLALGLPARSVTCLAVVATPPAGRPLTQLELAMDSVRAQETAAAGDSVRMDIMLPDAAAALTSARPLPTPPPFRTQDEELLWLVRAVPGGFGGYWRGSSAEPMKVYLVDLVQAPQAKRLLQAYFRQRPPEGGAPQDILFMRARWDVAALIGWRDQLRRAGAAAGVRAAVLRLDGNRVQVSVSGPAGRARLRARLAALGVPEAALFIVG